MQISLCTDTSTLLRISQRHPKDRLQRYARKICDRLDSSCHMLPAHEVPLHLDHNKSVFSGSVEENVLICKAGSRAGCTNEKDQFIARQGTR